MVGNTKSSLKFRVFPVIGCIPIPTLVIELKIRPCANVHRVSCDFLHACYTVMSPLYSRHNLGFVYHTEIPDTFWGSTLDHAPLPSALQFLNRVFRSILPFENTVHIDVHVSCIYSLYFGSLNWDQLVMEPHRK